MIRMGPDYACEHYETSQPSGMVFPNTLAVNATKYYLAANFHQTIKYLHDLAGGLVITVPMEADLRNEESGKFIRKFLYTRKRSEEQTSELQSLMRISYAVFRLKKQ